MPDWVVLLVLAIVSWLTLAVGGGLLLGRVLDALARRAALHRRRVQ